jgi:hypothetical protein
VRAIHPRARQSIWVGGGASWGKGLNVDREDFPRSSATGDAERIDDWICRLDHQPSAGGLRAWVGLTAVGVA